MCGHLIITLLGSLQVGQARVDFMLDCLVLPNVLLDSFLFHSSIAWSPAKMIETQWDCHRAMGPYCERLIDNSRFWANIPSIVLSPEIHRACSDELDILMGRDSVHLWNNRPKCVYSRRRTRIRQQDWCWCGQITAEWIWASHLKLPWFPCL